MPCSQMKSSGTRTRQGSHGSDDFVDCGAVIGAGSCIDPRKTAIAANDGIAAELASVGCGPLELVALTKQLHVLLCCLPTPDPPERSTAETQRVIRQAVFVAHHGEWVGEAPPVRSKHSWVGKGDHDNLAVTQFVSSIAHGVDVCFARQSSEVAVQDQHQGLANGIARLPDRAGVIDEIDIGKGVADRQRLAGGVASVGRVSGVHTVSEPTISPVTSHDRPFGRYLEDFEPGDIFKHWPGKTITEADDHLFCMITMNHHPLHTNQWFAENETVHGKNVVVGNLVYSLVLGMSVPDVSGAAIANLEIETLRHSMPTFHGDTIYAETRVLAKRETSKGDRGIVEVETKGLNQRGEEVCYFKRKVLVWKQENAPKRQRPYDESIWSED